MSNWDVSKVTSMSQFIVNCTSLTSIGDTTNWNTSSCTDMSSMFNKCYSLRELNVSNWNVSKVTTFKSMFSGSNYGEQHMQVTELDVSKWNTSSATDMGWMFYGNPQLKTLDVSNWDVSKVTSFHHMFAWSPGQVLDDKVTNWDVSSGIHFNAMFHSNRSVVLDLSKWNVSNGKNFGQMFENCKHLTEIKGLENWNTSNGQAFYSMFSGCRSLRELDLSSFDTRNANPRWVDDQRGATTSGMDDKVFGVLVTDDAGAPQTYNWNMSLEKVTLGPNFSFNGDGTCSSAAVLTPPSSDYVPGTDGYWYDVNGNQIAPADIPNRTAGIYYASLSRVEELDVLVKNATLFAVADAIRDFTGSGDTYKPSEFAEAIGSVPSYAEGVADATQAAYDAFWDNYQIKGMRTDYDCAFGGYGWTINTFKPKYDIRPDRCQYLFAYNAVLTDLKTLLSDAGVVLDTSKAVHVSSMFNTTSNMIAIPAIDLSSAVSSTGVFVNARKLVTIDELKLARAVTTNSWFQGCNSLKNIMIDGEIGENMDIKWSPLSVDSMKSIITHLVNYSGTEYDQKHTVKFSDACWANLAADGTLSPNGNSWSDYVLDLGWLK